jgi:hypothetical protein
MKYKGSPANFGVWFANQARSAVVEKDMTEVLKIARDPKLMSVTKRLIELNRE